MGDGTLRLERRWTGVFGGPDAWVISLDGAMVGSITTQETVEVAVEPGRHRLRLRQGRHRSPERSFDVAQDEVISFDCHGPRIWPMLLAAQFKSDLWITLRRE